MKFILLCLALSAPSAFSATSFTGTFNLSAPGINNATTWAYNGAPIDDITVSNISKVGITGFSGTEVFRGAGWPTGATNGSNVFTGVSDPDKYITFSLTADEGYTLDLTSLTFNVSRTATGPRQLEWRSSVDGYASAIDSYSAFDSALSIASGVLTTPDSNNSTSNWNSTLDLSDSAYSDLTEVTFRLYGYSAESSSGGQGGLMGNLTFTGSVVPEPTSAVLGAFGALGLLGIRRRPAHSC